MKGIVVYDSSHGNTRKVAEVISDILKKSGLTVDLFHVKEAKKIKANDYHFLIIGSPTKFGTMTFSIRLFLRKVKENQWKGKPFVTFDTQNPENIENDDTCASEKIAEKLIERKMKQISTPLKVLVNDWKGPLLDGEIEKVERYAVEIFENLQKV
jgi:flavodoxin